MSTQPPVLAQECEDFLRSTDLFAAQHENDPSLADIRGVDAGDYLFTVPKGVDLALLVTIVSHGSRQHELGRHRGEAGLAERLRSLIGAAPAEGQL